MGYGKYELGSFCKKELKNGKKAPKYRPGRVVCRPRPLGLSCVELRTNEVKTKGQETGGVLERWGGGASSARANTPTERRGYTAGGSAGDPVHGTRAGIIHVNLEGFAGRFRSYEAEAGEDD